MDQRTSESPTVKVMNYISRYDPKSETRIQRLLFLLRSDNFDAKQELYSMLEKQLKESGNVRRYMEIFGESNISTESLDEGMEMELASASKEVAYDYNPSKYGFHYDQHFVDTSIHTTRQQLATLETNLHTSRSSLARDAILQASIQLAKHLMVTGNSAEAMHQLSTAKSYCSSQRQMQELFLLLAESALNSGYYQKVKELYDPSCSETANDANKSFVSKLNAARGVAYLAEGKMKEAAKSFLAVTSELTNEFHQVLSSEDIALYGGLSALVALDRKEMEIMVMSRRNQRDGINHTPGNAFVERLEVIPHLKEAIEAYIRAEYAECLSMVRRLKERWEMDMYLGPQSDELWKRIQGKCLVQYFVPYSSVSLHHVMESFSFENMDQVENAVAHFIERKDIRDMKIDGVNKVLNGMSVDQVEHKRRRAMLRKLGRMGDRLLNEVEGMLLRTTCVQRGVVVGGAVGKLKGRRRDWMDVMSKQQDMIYGLQSSDEDGEGKPAAMDDDEVDMMDIDQYNVRE